VRLSLGDGPALVKISLSNDQVAQRLAIADNRADATRGQFGKPTVLSESDSDNTN
jgi:hypothetical protein